MKETIYSKFLESIIRYFIVLLAGYLVRKGVVDVETANKFTASAALQLTAALIAFAGALWFSYKDRIFSFVKTRVGIALPPNTSIEKVVAIANSVADKKAVATGQIDLAKEIGKA